VNCFEVSPRGSFLIAVVNEELFSLKYLPEGMIPEMRDTIEPFYYAEVNRSEIKEERYKKDKRELVLCSDNNNSDSHACNDDALEDSGISDSDAGGFGGLDNEQS